MKKFFLIPLLTLVCSVMAFANVAQITFSDEREAVDCADLAALQEAIEALPTDGTVATIKLLDHIDGGTLSGSNVLLNFLASQKVVLDLNAQTISANITSKTAYIIKNDGADLTINDLAGGEKGVIENTNDATNHWTYPMIFSDNSAAKFNFVRGKFIAGSGLVLYAQDNTVTIEDGVEMYTYMPWGIGSGKSNSPVMYIKDHSVVTINGGIFESAGSAAILLHKNSGSYAPSAQISGGRFVGNEGYGAIAVDVAGTVNITGGSYNLDLTYTNYIDQTVYGVINNDGMYTVFPLESPIVSTVYNFAELKSALNASTAAKPVNITLGADVVVNEEVELKHGSTLLIPAGRTLSVVTGGLFVNEGVTTNNGTIAIEGAGFFSKPAQVTGSGSFTGYQIAMQDGKYFITTAMQLQFLSILNTEDFSLISMETDINLPDVYFEPIQWLKCEFDGNNHSISNVKIKANADAGLFVWQARSVRNLTINANVETYAGYVGILSRCVVIDASDCSCAELSIEVKNVTVNGSVIGRAGYGGGGITGQVWNNNGDRYVRFVNCTNNANVTILNAANVGGFVGTNTSSNGNVGFYNCVNNGNVSAKNNVGAFVGFGAGTAAARSSYEFINVKNEGEISRSSGSAVETECGIELIGHNSSASKITCDYINPGIYTAVYDEADDKYVAKLAGTIDNTAASTVEWNKTTTWTDEGDGANPDDYMVPSEADVVTVNNAAGGVVVNDGVEAEAKQVIVAADKTLTIEDGGSLVIGEGGLQIAAGATVTVEEGATLVVGKDGITGDGELIVEATEDGGTGVVLVDPAAPAAKARPEAKIELIPDAHFVSGELYKYRYIGIPLYFEGSEEFVKATNWEVSDPGATIYFKQWNNGAWEELTAWNQLVPFKGYATSNSTTNNLKYTFKGKLIGNGDGTMNFSYGFNLFANSYAAPINIQTLLNGLSNDVKATIYMFKEDKLQTVSKADFAGFRTPKFTVIPSLQAFFVLMDDGTSATEDINYAEAVYNNSLANGPLYAPKHQEAPAFNRVRINIASENGVSDEVYLIEAADYTNDFENGFDEVKYMNNGLNLFATTAYGRQSTKISNDLNGTFIGVQGNGTYTLSFDELTGEEYEIRDLETNAVVSMSEANTYTFTINGTNDARFVVQPIAKMPTALDNVGEAKMFINNNTLFISENNSNANIMIYAANGQLVLNEVAQPTVSLNGLANGVYTVRVANQTLKFVK